MINSMEQSLSWEADSQLVNKFPTWAHHWTLCWSKWIQSIPSHPITFSSILMLFSHLCPCLPSGFCPSGFQIKVCMHFLCLPYATYLILFYLITLLTLCEEYKLLYSFLHPPITSSIFCPPPCSQTLSIHVLPLGWEAKFHTQKSHLYGWFWILCARLKTYTIHNESR
jgi:hypothetical protein